MIHSFLIIIVTPYFFDFGTSLISRSQFKVKTH
nr:MAG TPA: hypothetical protein [Caudoviricetes sp.]